MHPDGPHGGPHPGAVTGPLVLAGGDPHPAGGRFDLDLMEDLGVTEVTVVPTAAAYEHPERALTALGARLGAIRTRPCMVLKRSDATDPGAVAAARDARALWFPGGSALHLRSVLRGSPFWDAVVGAWRSGTVLVATGAAAAALSDPMVDARGGAFTVGLGLLDRIAVIPGADRWSADALERTLAMAPPDVTVAVLGASGGLVSTGGRWRAVGDVRLVRGGATVTPGDLPAPG